MQALSSFVVYRKLFFSKGRSARVAAEPEPQPPSTTSSFSAHGSLPTPLPSPPEIVFDITPDDHGQSPSIRERVKGPIPWRHDAHTSLDGSNEDVRSIALWNVATAHAPPGLVHRVSTRQWEYPQSFCMLRHQIAQATIRLISP